MIDLSYVAGVIDSRAHIEVLNRHGKPQPRLSVTTKRLGLLNHLATLTGTKVSVDERGYEKKGCGEHCDQAHIHVARQSAKWRVDCLRATIVLHNVLPMLVDRRLDASAALTVGLESYPAARGDTAKQMVKLGWDLPQVVRPLQVVTNRSRTS